LYGPDDEPIQTYSRAIITTRFLERAMELSGLMGAQEVDKEALQALDQLLVDFFGGQFTLNEIAEGGDFGEKITVLNAIMTKAAVVFSGATPNGNPTRPGTKKRTRTRQKSG